VCVRDLAAGVDRYGPIDHTGCAGAAVRRRYQFWVDEAGHEIASGQDALRAVRTQATAGNAEKGRRAKPPPQMWVTSQWRGGVEYLYGGRVEVVAIQLTERDVHKIWHCAGLAWKPRDPIGIRCDHTIRHTITGRNGYNDDLEFKGRVWLHWRGHWEWRNRELAERGRRARRNDPRFDLDET